MKPHQSQNHLRSTDASSYLTSSLRVAKVVARNADGTVDVVLNHGGLYKSCPVCSPWFATDAGQHYIPAMDLVNQQQATPDVYDVPTPTKTRDLYAIVAFVDGNSRNPFVLGFLPPPNNQLVGQEGLYVSRHESGVYETIDAQGSHEMVYPDGTYILVSPTETQPKNMAAINPNWKVTPGQTATVTIHHSSGSIVQVNPSGQISITAVGGASLTMHNDGSLVLSGGHGGSLTIGTDGTVTITGKASSQSW